MEIHIGKQRQTANQIVEFSIISDVEDADVGVTARRHWLAGDACGNRIVMSLPLRGRALETPSTMGVLTPG